MIMQRKSLSILVPLCHSAWGSVRQQGFGAVALVLAQHRWYGNRVGLVSIIFDIYYLGATHAFWLFLILDGVIVAQGTWLPSVEG
ncbi:hypothetical protein BDV36DRAFT_200802 [Aspergillus pseudocaelatus]|uniref:Uncharacterized protein n=1 Tax=Aspergillus pseudocaelatus TaxID=1825620 RepID=A0ABQ6WK84_9EURO|nr:hypothetical protein BDV36DRAFT_200802 [Aspergillus pseudocaelatus]